MTETEFLARCSTIWRKGHARPELFALMRDWLDFVMRLEHTLLSTGQSQGEHVLDFLVRERERLSDGRTLAGDADGYALQEIAAILSHPCQICASQVEAWHTRPGFCTHGEVSDD